MRLAVAALASAAAVSADRAAFETFKTEFGKAYASPAEEARRFATFEDSLREAAVRNAEGHAEHGVTKFSDWTSDEFNALLGYQPGPDDSVLAEEIDIAIEALPKKMDWSKKGATTPVKDQGHCGSCWAFSATEQIESDAILQKNVTVVLSPQECVDCDKSSQGCGGGYPPGCFKQAQKGMEKEKDYKYTGKDGSCAFSASKKAVVVKSSSSQGSEKAMQKYIGTKGPLSFCAQAASWSSYKKGILQKCGSGGGHCIQMVGYDTSGSIPYWIVRNSWGTKFGVDGGFIHIEMFKGLCGIKSGWSTTIGEVDVPTPPPAPPAPPVPPDAARYHCDKDASQCIVAIAGHSTVGTCLTACASPVPPDAVRYHCDKASHLCTAAEAGHSTVATCLAACQA